MTPLTIPESGVTLIEFPRSNTDESTSKPEGKPIQAMQLELTDDVLHEILRSARNGGKGMNMSFGKTIMLHYGNNSQTLGANAFPLHTQLYEYSTDNENELVFAGRLSHKLAMQKAQEDVAGADEALAKLQSQLASHEKDKQSKQITYVRDSSTLPPPIKQTAATLKQHSVKPNSLSFLKKHNTPTYLNNNTTRSMPTSPSLGAARTPLNQKPTPTSIPTLHDGKTQRLQALRTPLIHFLAARPASTKLLVQHLNCKEEDVLKVLQKVGKRFRLDESKWDLTDKAFKELDIWDFHFPNEGDRQLAINRAISAFDRMRLSTSEKLWDMLIPKIERGKGKILSHLNHLHKGPIQQATTPKIQIQHPSNDSREDSMRDNDSDQKDRLAPSDAEPMARSRSHGPIKKTKVSEKEAKSKRLLSNGPKKATPAPKFKEAHPAVKKGGVKKANVPKSSEFVNDSDEEDGLEDAATLQAQALPPKKTEKTSKPPKPAVSSQPAEATTKPKVLKPTVSSQSIASTLTGKKNSSKPARPNPAGTTPKSRPTNVVNGKDARAKEMKNANKATTLPVKVQEKKAVPPTTSAASSPAPKHRMSDSSQGSTAMKKTLSRQRTTSSPHKPSPLGSSPPTNASDFDNPAHSSTSSTPSVSKTSATPNGVGTHVNGHARNTSEHTLKRKAGDLDSDIHNHGIPVTNGNVNGYVNGNGNGNTNSAKRHKASDMTPPTSESDSSPIARDVALKKAQDFKKYYANYEKQYCEVQAMGNPSKETIEALMRMHNRLAELKDQITKGLVGI